MQELKNDIEKQAENIHVNFLETSKKWANYSLEMYSGELLSKGLDISKALADFYFKQKEVLETED